MNTIFLLVLAAISIKAQIESRESSCPSDLNEKLESCEALSYKLKKKVIEFKFRLTELEGQQELINALNNTINIMRIDCDFRQKFIDFCQNSVSTFNVDHEKNTFRNMQDIFSKQITPFRTPKEQTSCLSTGYSSDIVTLYLPGTHPITIYCDGDTAGPGWAVIQRRLNGSENFYRNWTEYREGFGQLTAEHFIGLHNLYMMTNYEPYELYIQFVDFNNEIFYAHYDLFEIGNEAEKYKLKKLGNMTGNVANKLIDHLGHKFSTYDQDNDNALSENIAMKYRGGWWYYEGRLYGCNLNGEYFSNDTEDISRLHWKWKGYKEIKMLIRPINHYD